MSLGFVGFFSLRMGHFRTLLEIRAGTERGVNVASYYQRPGWSVAVFCGDGIHLLREGFEELSRDRVSGFGPVKQQHTYMPRARGRNLLDLDDFIFGARAVS